MQLSVVHESLDTLNTMLENVKQRKPLVAATRLIADIEKISRGEVLEKRAVERFDVEMEELAAPEEDVVTSAPEPLEAKPEVVKPEETKPASQAPVTFRCSRIRHISRAEAMCINTLVMW